MSWKAEQEGGGVDDDSQVADWNDHGVVQEGANSFIGYINW